MSDGPSKFETTAICTTIVLVFAIIVVGIVGGYAYSCRVFEQGNYELKTIPGHNQPVWVKAGEDAKAPQ